MGTSRSQDYHPLEQESPTFLVLVIPSNQPLPHSVSPFPSQEIDKYLQGSPSNNNNNEDTVEWFGKSNTLSWEHYRWNLVDQTIGITKKEETTISQLSSLRNRQLQTSNSNSNINNNNNSNSSNGKTANSIYSVNDMHKVIRERRSALDFNGTIKLSREQFFSMLSRLSPHDPILPRSSLSTINNNSNNNNNNNNNNYFSHIHMGIIVWGVEDIPSGYYLLVRNEEEKEELKNIITKNNAQYEWIPVEESGIDGLYRLGEHNDPSSSLQSIAERISCNQRVAKTGNRTIIILIIIILLFLYSSSYSILSTNLLYYYLHHLNLYSRLFHSNYVCEYQFDDR